jgi:predicted Zn-dependent protease with MMP-like domain
MWTRFRSFLGHGRAVDAAWAFPLVAAAPAILIVAFRGDHGPAGTLLVLAVWCVIAWSLSWVIVARMASDAIAVAEQERAIDLQEQLADRAFLAGRPAFAFREHELAGLAEAELRALPRWIQTAVERENVVITIEDERAGQPRTLGLYQSSGYGNDQIREITLYRLAIVRAAGSRDRLREVVHDTLLHELGHLFGMSERDLDDYTIGNHPRPGAQPVHPPPEDQTTGR